MLSNAFLTGGFVLIFGLVGSILIRIFKRKSQARAKADLIKQLNDMRKEDWPSDLDSYCKNAGWQVEIFKLGLELQNLTFKDVGTSESELEGITKRIVQKSCVLALREMIKDPMRLGFQDLISTLDSHDISLQDLGTNLEQMTRYKEEYLAYLDLSFTIDLKEMVERSKTVSP